MNFKAGDRVKPLDTPKNREFRSLDLYFGRVVTVLSTYIDDGHQFLEVLSPGGNLHIWESSRFELVGEPQTRSYVVSVPGKVYGPFGTEDEAWSFSEGLVKTERFNSQVYEMTSPKGDSQ